MGHPGEVRRPRRRARRTTTGRSRCRPITVGDVADRHAFVGDGVQRRARPAPARRPGGTGGPNRAGAPPASGWTRRRCSPTRRARGRSRPAWRRSRCRRRRGRSGGGARPTSGRRGPPGASTSSAVASRVCGPVPAAARAGSVPCPSASVATRPGARPSSPEAMTNGRSEPASASPNVSTARRSASAAPWKSPGEGDVVLEREVDHAVRLGGGARAACRGRRGCRARTSAPAAARAAADASERARPTT